MFRRDIPDGTHDENQANSPNDVQFEGIEFSDGSVAIRWLTAAASTSIWENMDTMLKVHGHPEYGSELVWLEPKESDKPWYGVDFDGTLATYNGFEGIDKLGSPIPEMVNRVKDWLSEGKKVKILTARFAYPEALAAIKDWCKKYIGSELDITDRKDFRMIELWDDRCVRVEQNTGKILSNEGNISKASHMTEGEVAFQQMEMEGREKNGESSKPIEIDKNISTMAPKEKIAETPEAIIGDKQQDIMKYSTAPGAFSMENVMPAEIGNTIGRPEKVNAVEEIKKKNEVESNKEPYYAKMVEIQAPNKYEKQGKTIFLAGSIDMGKAVDWQNKLVEALHDEDVTLLNPRREHFGGIIRQLEDGKWGLFSDD